MALFQRRSPAKAPLWVTLLLLASLALQLLWHNQQPKPDPSIMPLPAPPQLGVLHVTSLGEPAALSKALMLWLQAFDFQSGISVSFHNLNYHRVAAWLGRILELDPRANYPVTAASRLYGSVYDAQKQRIMLMFIHESFLKDPVRRWQALAHGAIVAKHQVKDLKLALKFARALRTNTQRGQIPSWARQMELVFLEDMGELESARFLIGGLMQSGEISDPWERDFFESYLKRLEKAEKIESR
uniref:Uncharacterized protein n=1 Tax=Magnetococcus massalia (strain MO-1) TaxID=451514 RepID=A0A1S7LKZ9_MAGMO|nr:conserved protein of unknown function [Candidatus Magnetococcus massalia]